MHDIFISYSRANEKLVTSVVKKLQGKGLDVWQDISGIPPSTDWLKSIETAIHASRAAIVFRTKTWKESLICDVELRIISKLHMPCYVVTAEGDNIDVEDLALEIEAWYNKTHQMENELRTSLLNKAFKFLNHPKSYDLLPKKQELSEMLALAKNRDYFRQPDLLYQKVSNMHSCSEEQLVYDSNILSASVRNLLEKAKKRQRWRRIRRVSATIFLLALIAVTSFFAVAVSERAAQSERAITQGGLLYVNRRIAEASPLEAMLTFIPRDVFTGQEMLSIRGNQLMHLSNKTYPILAFDGDRISAKEYVDDTVISESPFFQVETFDDSGVVIVTDMDNQSTARFTVEGVPSSYAWNRAGDMLIISAANHVYIYYARSRGTVTKLWGNAEQIEAVTWREDGDHDFDLIAARTEQNNVIIWINPILNMTHSHTIRNGMIAYIDGTAIPVYVVDSDIILQVDGEERKIPTGVEELTGLHLDTCAVNHYLALSNGSTVMIVDLLQEEIVYTHDFETSISDVAFSRDGNLLAVSSLNFDGIFTLNLGTGEVLHSGPSPFQLAAISPYREGWIVSVIRAGAVLVFDQNLQPEEEFTRHLLSEEFARRIVVSEEYGYLFSVSNGGNSARHGTRLHIDTREVYGIHLSVNTNTLSNSAVALSRDEDFVAFGSPDGQITVWDTVAMFMVWTSSAINEVVIDISFSSDNETLYVLGRSGTLYELETGGLYTMRTEREREAFMERLLAQAMAIIGYQYELGLTHHDMTSLIQMLTGYDWESVIELMEYYAP